MYSSMRGRWGILSSSTAASGAPQGRKKKLRSRGRLKKSRGDAELQLLLVGPTQRRHEKKDAKKSEHSSRWRAIRCGYEQRANAPHARKKSV